MIPIQWIITAILGSGVLSTLINAVFGLIKDRKAKKKNCGSELESVRNGLQQLMYDRIKYLCKSHISRGYIMSNDLEDLIRMHKTYHDDLHGNGYLDELMETVKTLKIIPAVPVNKED